MSLDLPILNNNLGRAACADISEDLKRKFYAKGNAQLKAKEVCNGIDGRPACPVKDRCLAEALAIENDPANESDQRHGVWGGLSAREREELFPQPVRPSRPRVMCGKGLHLMAGANVLEYVSCRRCRACRDEVRRRGEWAA